MIRPRHLYCQVAAAKAAELARAQAEAKVCGFYEAANSELLKFQSSWGNV